MSDSKAGEGSVGARDGAGGPVRRSTGFRVLDDSIELCAEVRVLVASIAKHDRKLATQLNDATKSVVANIAEGLHRKGGHQRERFETAYGSAQEVKAHLQVAWAFRVLDGGERAHRLADGIAAQLWRCQHRRH
ncbi:MAG: four helix bundle protein [Sandaracinaceae bacterium]